MPPEISEMPSHPPRRRWTAWKYLLIAAGRLIMLVVLLAPMVMRSRGGPGHDFVRTGNNLRQIGLSLLEFKTEFGSFPNDLTLAQVRELDPQSRIKLGISSSNDYFHQLFVVGIIDKPSHFYGYGVSTHRPFDVYDDQPIPPGTCGFAYIIRDSNDTPDDTPILVYPLIRGKLVFDTKLSKHWGNKALIVYADGSVVSHPIDSSGRVIIEDRDLFDPDHPHWHGRSFRVAWPE